MTSPSQEQLETLFSFLEEHNDLARGVLRSVEGRLQSQRLWGEICSTLNSMGGCTKSLQQWQRVWTDKKYIAKKKFAAARRSASASGGPSTAPQHSRWDNKVMMIMGNGFGEPQTSARVPAFVEHSETLEPSQLSETLKQPGLHIQESRDTIYTSPVAVSPPVTQGSSVLRSTRMRRERRVRRRHWESVRRKFFQIEEQRVAHEAQWTNEFAGIRVALTDLNNVLRQGLTEICDILRGRAQNQQN